MRSPTRSIRRIFLALAPLALAAGCASSEPGGPSSSSLQGPPIRFACSDGSLLVARYSQPDSSTLWLRRADGLAELKSQPAASGARYVGADVSFWEHQGEVALRWGPNAAPVTCKRTPA
ncbi:MliC family protein [Variovorax sp. OV329]|uniref:MliC family protein n=1 Tax=Variovorax sp. OV329 TaxID=1882825 RepID=UPI0008EBB200|nr:MliC family protein [Variovorax sp. OV329]SFM87389.1 Membrane-bound lysozyme-inhibitor of c-type lysozyme [Variovorax sp. OV329]